jgi:hypothetical protein
MRDPAFSELGQASACLCRWPNVYVLVVSLPPQMLVIPVTDTAPGVTALVTPDRLIGRSRA